MNFTLNKSQKRQPSPCITNCTMLLYNSCTCSTCSIYPWLSAWRLKEHRFVSVTFHFSLMLQMLTSKNSHPPKWIHFRPCVGNNRPQKLNDRKRVGFPILWCKSIYHVVYNKYSEVSTPNDAYTIQVA